MQAEIHGNHETKRITIDIIMNCLQEFVDLILEILCTMFCKVCFSWFMDFTFSPPKKFTKIVQTKIFNILTKLYARSNIWVWLLRQQYRKITKEKRKQYSSRDTLVCCVNQLDRKLRRKISISDRTFCPTSNTIRIRKLFIIIDNGKECRKQKGK